jgi:tyrosyl-tRNA synthetase
MDIFEDLKFRGLIYQITNEKGLREKLKKEKITLYCGFDPTAPSFHVGNLLLILTLRRFQTFGHKPIALLGGGTALIGDPSGKIKERPLLSEEKIKEWREKTKDQLKRFLDFKRKRNPAEILDNFEWLSKIRLIKFLRDYGKHFQLSQMLGKESVKKRISTTGISFCEFSYMILQAIDFLELKKRKNCDLQIGGSDQWGNIVSGIDLIRKILGVEVFGLTLPLILTKSGKKFGKTEEGAIFLDKKLTSPYKFYQFWINTDDKDVISFLKYFTFLKKEEILNLEQKLKKSPKKKEAQKVLAREVTKLVHGREEAKRVERISQILFYGDVKELKEKEIKEAFFNVPSIKIEMKRETPVLELLVLSRAVKSKSEAKRLIRQRGISINGELILEIDKIITKKEALYQKYFVIKKGKRNYYLVEC